MEEKGWLLAACCMRDVASCVHAWCIRNKGWRFRSYGYGHDFVPLLLLSEVLWQWKEIRQEATERHRTRDRKTRLVQWRAGGVNVLFQSKERGVETGRRPGALGGSGVWAWWACGLSQSSYPRLSHQGQDYARRRGGEEDSSWLGPTVASSR